MKKFMKVCAVTALIMILLGVVLGIVGSSVVGRAAISQVVDMVTGGRVHVEMGDGLWGIIKNVEVGDMKVNVGDISTGFGIHYDIGDSSMFSGDHEILSGDVDKYCPGSGIRNLKVEVGGCSFETKASEDGNIYLETKDIRKFQGYVEGDVLYVKATVGSGTSWIEDSKVVLYLPENYAFDEVMLDMGAGDMECKGLKAEEISMDAGAGRIVLDEVSAREIEASIGAGQIRLKSMQTGSLTADVGMGEFLADGTISGDVDVECSMGNVEIKIDGRKEDFNYRLEGAMGNINLDKDSYGGFAEEKNIDNGAGKTMDIECSMGNITIKFTK